MNRRTLLIISSISVWIFVIGLILYMFIARDKQPKTIEELLKNGGAETNSPKSVVLDDYYLFPPSPVFDPSKNTALNDFYESTIKNKDEKIKQLIKTQSLFNNNEELVKGIFDQIFTDKLKN